MSELKCSCTQENLAQALNIVGRVVSPKSALPVLSNILIQSEESGLKLAATDLEIGVTVFIGAKVEKKGAITIPARLVTDFINGNSDEKIGLEVKEGSLNIKSDHYVANLKGIDAEEFPLIPEVKEAVEVEMEASMLKEAIPQIVFAAATDESRPVLAGVYMNFNGDKLKLAATDSYRLAEKVLTLPKKVAKEISIIVPARTLQELSRILALGDGKVQIKITENQVLFSFKDEINLVSRLIEGQFPNYEQIIPTSSETDGNFVVSEMIQGVKIASLFARESANNIKFSFDPKAGNLVVQATTLQVGDNVSTIAGTITGNENEIAFNAKYVLDVLNNIHAEKIDISVSGKLNPGVFKPTGSKDYIYIIMPLRV